MRFFFFSLLNKTAWAGFVWDRSLVFAAAANMVAAALERISAAEASSELIKETCWSGTWSSWAAASAKTSARALPTKWIGEMVPDAMSSCERWEVTLVTEMLRLDVALRMGAHISTLVLSRLPAFILLKLRQT